MNKEVHGIIYLIRNEINKKMYIGQTTLKGGFDERYYGDISHTHNEHLKRSIKKYGVENFYIDKEFDIAYSQEELNKLEDMYIKLYETTDPKKGYNKMFGGSNGKHTEETKKKMSEAKKNKWKGENNPMFGRKLTDETKRKLSEAHKGKRLSKEHRENIGKSSKGRKHTEETKRRIGIASKERSMAKAVKVVCVTTGMVFDSIADGARFYGCSPRFIPACCRGERKSCGKLPDGTKLVWQYYEDSK